MSELTSDDVMILLFEARGLVGNLTRFDREKADDVADLIRLVSKHNELLDHALARIEALEARDRQREGGK